MGVNTLHTIDSGVLILTALFLGGFALSEFLRDKRAGPVVLDCGPKDTRGMWTATGVLFILTGFVFTISKNPPDYVQGLTHTLWGFAYLLKATGRFQVRQNGVLGRKLITWKDILEYHLDSNGTLRLKTRKSGWARGPGTVPAAKRPYMSRILAQKVG